MIYGLSRIRTFDCLAFIKEKTCHKNLHGPGDYKYYTMLHKVSPQFHHFHNQPMVSILLSHFVFLNVGLAYLHHGRNIIHRDVKSSNILLSENLEGKMSDFGISKVNQSDTYNATTRIVGTKGYLDPA